MRAFILRSMLALGASQVEAPGDLDRVPPAVRAMAEWGWRFDGIFSALAGNFWFGGKK